MLNRLSWLIAIILITVAMVSCTETGNNGTFGGSDVLIRHMSIGNIPIQVEETHNIPLAQVTKIRFELNRPVTQQSLAQVFNFEILVTNLDTDITYRFMRNTLEENGALVWLDEGENKIVEYRMNHTMDRIIFGGQTYLLGQAGNQFKVDVVFLVGQSSDGRQWSYTDDTFYIVWTDSSQDI